MAILNTGPCLDVYLQLPLNLVRQRTSHGALDKAVGVGLWSIYLGIFTRVLEVFVPAEVCERLAF